MVRGLICFWLGQPVGEERLQRRGDQRHERGLPPYAVLAGGVQGERPPYSTGRSRQGAPVHTRYRNPSISLRWNNAGRPVAATGNNGSSTAHCASLKSPRAALRSSRRGAINATGF